MYRHNHSPTIREEIYEYIDEEYLDAISTPKTDDVGNSLGNAMVTAGVVTASAANSHREQHPGQLDDITMEDVGPKESDETSEGSFRSKQPPRITLDWFFWTMAGMTLVFLALVGYGFGSGLYLPNKSKSMASGNTKSPSGDASRAQGDSSSLQVVLDNRQDYKDSILTLLGLPAVMERSSPQARAIEWLAFDDEPLFDPKNADLEDPRRQQQLAQRYALVVWYFAQSGPTMWTTLNREASTGWIQNGPGVHECDWRGVDCDEPQEYDGAIKFPSVIGLRILPYMGLVMTGPSVSTELGMLTDLRYIDFSNHRLQGKIPDEWSKLTNLEFVALSKNQLQSTIPEWIGGWTNLQFLALNGNLLYGTIPSSVSTLQNLESLELHENPQLRGRFDVLFSNALQKSLIYIDLSNTDLEGELPEITLPSLKFLRLWNTNGFGGTLPPEIGSWSNLEYFSTKKNPKLVGTIPTQFGLLQNLKTLEVLECNFMSGMLPTELGNLSSDLAFINFRSINQTGSLPAEWSNIGGLQLLDVSTNNLEGTVPPEYSKLTQLEFMDLRGTKLTGEVPDGVCSLESRDEFLADCSNSKENSTSNIQCICCEGCNTGNSDGDGGD